MEDRALVELNRAVVHSYDKAGVYIVDHHTAAAQFITPAYQAGGRPRSADGPAASGGSRCPVTVGRVSDQPA